MKRFQCAVVAGLLASLWGAPLAAQGGIELSAHAGAVTPMGGLDRDGFREFKAGINAGAAVAFWLDENLGLRLDGGFQTSKMQCALVPNPSGTPVDACATGESGAGWKKLLFGADLMLRGVTAAGWRPFAFLGVGMVRLDESGTRIETATRPAARFGLGLGYAPAGGSLGFFGEGALFVYNFDQTLYPFYSRVQQDLTLRAGISFKIR